LLLNKIVKARNSEKKKKKKKRGLSLINGNSAESEKNLQFHVKKKFSGSFIKLEKYSHKFLTAHVADDEICI
jgi:hypothetical protein